MKALKNFAVQCGAKLSLNPEFIVNKGGRYFLVNKNLRGCIQKDFYYVGTYLGKVKKGKFFPSFNLLVILARGDANKVVVDKKAAWLFICGRDIFRRGMLTARGSRKKGDHTLVMNEFGECLGFGKIVHGLSEETKKNEVAVKNILDVGDFLRREVYRRASRL